MFHLYGNVAGWKELDVSKDEIDIVHTIEQYKKGNTNADFIVVDKQPERHDISTTISKEQDFTEYKQKVLTKKRGF